MENLYAIILAGGKGKRLGSEAVGIPKAMREANGKPLLSYMLKELDFIEPSKIVIVVGYMKEAIQSAFPEYRFATQEAQLGTGDAANSARSVLSNIVGDVIVAYGDNPLLKRDSFKALVDKHRKECNDCTILGGTDDGVLDYSGYGRVITAEDGSFQEIIEAKDFTPGSIPEERISYNTLYVFKIDKLFDALSRITTNNAQGEYYLTDAPAIIKADGGKVGVLAMPLGYQLQGVNTLKDLETVENYLRNAK